MERCDHPTRGIFKHNLEIIKTFVEVWKERIDVPTKYVDYVICNTFKRRIHASRLCYSAHIKTKSSRSFGQCK